MQYTSALVLAVATLATAAPATLDKRESYSCGLTNYQDATEGPINDGYNYLMGNSDNQPDDVYWSTPNGCTLISESYGTGFSLCQTGGSRDPYDPKDLAGYVKALYGSCKFFYGTVISLYVDNDALGVGGLSNGGGTTVHAMQYWGNGFNILIKGGF